MKSVLVVVAWASVGLYADVLFKRAPSLGSWQFVTACGLYAACGFAAFYGFRLQQWGWIGLMWSAVQIVASLACSVLLFGESFTLRRGLAGLLALAAILLAE